MTKSSGEPTPIWEKLQRRARYIATTHVPVARMALRGNEQYPDIAYYYRRMLVPALLPREGYMSPSQAIWLADWMHEHPDVKRVAEIGFNLGHSAVSMLASREDVSVTSFELGVRTRSGRELDRSARRGKRVIDAMFPGRHTIVVGDSQETVPQTDLREFDAFYVDGGHDLETVRNDLRNIWNDARQGASVLLDDYDPTKPWGIGPFTAWNEMCDIGLIKPLGDYEIDVRHVAVGQTI